MIQHKDSHLDHFLTEAQIAHILERFADKDAFFIETFELPEDLGAAVCGLYGPVMGDAPVADLVTGIGYNEGAVYRKRGTRSYESRVVPREMRPTRTVTVIGGPHVEAVDGTDPVRLIEHRCILYTAFGGPLAPQEPGDLRAQVSKIKETPDMDDLVKAEKLAQLEQKLIASTTFWSVHALSSD